jgi:hypothetical protein
MKRLARISATVASSAFLIAGVAGVAGASPMVTGNGNNATSDVVQTAEWNKDVDNNTAVEAENNNPQDAVSGAAVADDNTDAGNVGTGTAANASTTNGSVLVDYSSANDGVFGGGSGAAEGLADVASPEISDNGNGSENTVTQHATVNHTATNNSAVTVTNNNTQAATSGDATATNNNTAGAVTTGAASNTSTTSFNVTVRY